MTPEQLARAVAAITNELAECLALAITDEVPQAVLDKLRDALADLGIARFELERHGIGTFHPASRAPVPGTPAQVDHQGRTWWPR